MKLRELSEIHEAVRRQVEVHGKLPPAYLLVHSMDDWRAIALRGGVKPIADGQPESSANAFGVPVRAAPLVCPKGEVVLLVGLDLGRGLAYSVAQ